MNEGDVVLQVLAAGMVALGLLAVLVGFFNALFGARQGSEGNALAFVALGAAAVTAGLWLMRSW